MCNIMQIHMNRKRPLSELINYQCGTFCFSLQVDFLNFTNLQMPCIYTVYLQSNLSYVRIFETLLGT